MHAMQRTMPGMIGEVRAWAGFVVTEASIVTDVADRLASLFCNDSCAARAYGAKPKPERPVQALTLNRIGARPSGSGAPHGAPG